ncbi:MAG: FixH family protein [Campylobacterota bacterium]|nr:FixH family protein [Campylobacterota bacterium]
MEKKHKKTYWPHMILGFLAVGLTLSYWTVKSASSLPVQESNQYMLKYQMADITINDIIERKKAFDKAYTIEIEGIETMVMTDNVNSNRPQPNPVKLSLGKNKFSYLVRNKDGSVVSDAKVSFLLTQPHSRRNDIFIERVDFSNGTYATEDLEISEAGRYTLQFRAIIGDAVGYSEIPAYLKP